MGRGKKRVGEGVVGRSLAVASSLGATPPYDLAEQMRELAAFAEQQERDGWDKTYADLKKRPWLTASAFVAYVDRWVEAEEEIEEAAGKITWDDWSENSLALLDVGWLEFEISEHPDPYSRRKHPPLKRIGDQRELKAWVMSYLEWKRWWLRDIPAPGSRGRKSSLAA